MPVSDVAIAIIGAMLAFCVIRILAAITTIRTNNEIRRNLRK